MNTHSFDINVAAEYGVNAAVVVQNFQFWIAKNMANERHQYEGRCWTYNSIEALCVLFPYLSTRQVRTALDLLEERGVLMAGNFNSNSHNRTKWFAFVDEAKWLNSTICQRGQMDLSERANGFVREGKSRTYTKPDTKPDKKESPPVDCCEDLPDRTDEGKAVKLWNNMAERAGLSLVQRLTKTRRSKLVRRLKDCGGVEGWKVALSRVENTGWMTGDNEDGRKWNIDTILGEKVFTKLMEGGYDHGPPRQSEDGWAVVAKEAVNG